MGPIIKKIEEYLKTEGLSEETILVLKNLKKETKPLEKQIVNDSYFQGFSDKERGKSPSWDHHSSKYTCLLKAYTFGKVN